MALFKYLSRSYRIYKSCYPVDYTLDKLTISCYINVNHHVNDQHIIGTPALGYQIFLRSIDGFSYLAARIGIVEIIEENPIEVKEWIHVAITYDGTIFRLFKNGKEVDIKVANIRYGGDIREKWVWLYHNNTGGSSVHIGINLFNIWNLPLSKSEIEWLSNLNNPAELHEDNIVLADYLDFPDNRHVHGIIPPCDVVNEFIDESPLSPFPGGVVPYPIVDFDSSSTSSQLSMSTSSSDPSSISTSSTSSTSTSSTSSDSTSSNTSFSTSSTSDSSISTSSTSSTSDSSISTSSTSSTNTSVSSGSTSSTSTSSTSSTSESTPSSTSSWSSVSDESFSSSSQISSSSSLTSSTSQSSQNSESTPTSQTSDISSASTQTSPTSQTSDISSASTQTSPTSQTSDISSISSLTSQSSESSLSSISSTESLSSVSQCDPVNISLVNEFSNGTAVFGRSVSVNDNFDLAAVGTKTSTYGQVYIYTRSGDTWSHSHTLNDPALNNLAEFGRNVELSGDGNWLAVQSDGQSLNNDQGKVYIYENVSGTFTLRQTLVDTDAAASYDDRFGFGLTLDQDGDILIASAPKAAGYVAANQGAVIYFRRTGTTFTRYQKFTGTDIGGVGDVIYFGGNQAAQVNQAVYLNQAGDKLIVGQPTPNNTEPSGTTAVYIYTRSGDVWSLDQKITPASSTYEIGQSVCIDDTENRIVFNDVIRDSSWVYVLSGGSYVSEWEIAFNGQSHLRFNDDGSILFLSYEGSGGATAGETFGYRRSGSTWTNVKILAGSILGARFGAGMVLDEDGFRLLIGAPTATTTGKVGYYSCF